jgi:hypothetical protein
MVCGPDIVRLGADNGPGNDPDGVDTDDGNDDDGGVRSTLNDAARPNTSVVFGN